MLYPVEISGRVVQLRESRKEDSAASLCVAGDDRVTRWLSYDSRSEAEAETMISGAMERARLEPRTEYYLAVTADDQFVGFCRLGFNGVKAAKLVYAIAADHWGTDTQRTRLKCLRTTGSAHLGLHRISVAIAPDTNSSIEVAVKLGMQLEGRIRHHAFTNRGWRNSLLCSVLAEEWSQCSMARSSKSNRPLNEL
ncbi:GNAT family N-acetyltransferase [Actinoplanes xinjiangensis]|uniref:GNAT family N-acetyltransferase n=1 Tax=Actinoplanes xinjiangensis TaxID=512350 RepID=UPI003433F843